MSIVSLYYFKLYLRILMTIMITFKQVAEWVAIDESSLKRDSKTY